MDDEKVKFIQRMKEENPRAFEFLAKGATALLERIQDDLRPREHELLTTKGEWYDDIANGLKWWDYREGILDIKKGDTVIFAEEENRIKTGRSCRGFVTYVRDSTWFADHFRKKNADIFTIIQFVIEK